MGISLMDQKLTKWKVRENIYQGCSGAASQCCLSRLRVWTIVIPNACKRLVKGLESHLYNLVDNAKVMKKARNDQDDNNLQNNAALVQLWSETWFNLTKCKVMK